MADLNATARSGDGLQLGELTNAKFHRLADESGLSDLENLAIAVWPEVVEAIDVLVARAERGDWTLIPRSSLAGDDRATQPFQTSHAIHMLMNAGIDALNGVRHLVWGRPEGSDMRPVVHQAAHYVLARAAIENFATALWILQPAKRALRVERTLRWHVKNVTDQHSALDPMGLETTRSKEVRLTRIEDVARNSIGELPTHFRRGYTATEALRYVDATNTSRGQGFLSARLIWQLCSGFAHGRPWSSLTFQEQERLPTDDPDILSVRLTSDMTRALLAPKEALHLLERLLRLHDQRNAPPFGT